MFLAEVDISKTAYFMMTQNFSQVVTKFIPCDDVTRFDGIFYRTVHYSRALLLDSQITYTLR